jgi:hypothetical protein
VTNVRDDCVEECLTDSPQIGLRFSPIVGGCHHHVNSLRKPPPVCSEFPGMGPIFGAALGFYGFRADVLILLSLQHNAPTTPHKRLRQTCPPQRNPLLRSLGKSLFSGLGALVLPSPTCAELTRLGKSSLTVQFVDGHFIESYYPTIENTFRKTIKYRGHEYECEILDTAGQVRPPQRY